MQANEIQNYCKQIGGATGNKNLLITTTIMKYKIKLNVIINKSALLFIFLSNSHNY